MSFLRRRGPELAPGFLIAGLGNPGAQYRGTRHNIGFEVIDALAKKHKIKVDQNQQRAMTGVGEVNGLAVALVKPLTFMNLSGQSIGPLLKKWGLKPSQLLVIADDLDLETGRVRLKPKGSSGGHNGHKSIIATLGTDDYPRIKIGIGKAGETIDHVLGKFHPDDRADMEKAIERSVEGVEIFIASGIELAMNRINGT